jgi:hypothetical protein
MVIYQSGQQSWTKTGINAAVALSPLVVGTGYMIGDKSGWFNYQPHSLNFRP